MAHILTNYYTSEAYPKIFFADLTKKVGIILIHSCQTAIVVLAVVIFLFGSLREKRSVPLTKE